MKKLLVCSAVVVCLPLSLYSMRPTSRGLPALLRIESRASLHPFKDPAYSRLTAQTQKIFPKNLYEERERYLSLYPFSAVLLDTSDHDNNKQNFIVMLPKDGTATFKPVVWVPSLDPVSSLNIQSIYSIFGFELHSSFQRAVVAPEKCSRSIMNYEKYDIWANEYEAHIKKAAHMARRFSTTLQRPLLVADSLGTVAALKVLAKNPAIFSGALFINPIGDMEMFVEDNPWFHEYLEKIPAFKEEGKKKFYATRFTIADFIKQLRIRCLLVDGRKNPYHMHTMLESGPSVVQAVHIPGEMVTSECSTLISASAGHYIRYALDNFFGPNKSK